MAIHISGVRNTEADGLSRRHRDHSYSLPDSLFSFFCEAFDFSPSVDLFASRVNFKLPNYYSAGPDPFANNFDAFLCSWPDKVYAFPPINLVDQFLLRFLNLQIPLGILVCPFWPSQPYYPTLLGVLIDVPFLISASRLVDSDLLPSSLSQILVCFISSNCALQKAYQRTLQHAFSDRYTPRPSVHTFEAGSYFQIGVLNNKCIMAICQ